MYLPRSNEIAIYVWIIKAGDGKYLLNIWTSSSKDTIHFNSKRENQIFYVFKVSFFVPGFLSVDSRKGLFV